MEVPNGAALHKYIEGRREDESLSLTELGEKYRGVKTLEYMIRSSYDASLERTPSEVSVGQEIQDIEGNAYSVPPWSILMPVEGLDHESVPETLAEETGHNIDKLYRRNLDLDDTLTSVYREFAAAAMRDEIFEGSIDASVQDYRDTRDEIDDFYSRDELATTIQSDIENIVPLAEETLEVAERVDWDPEIGSAYEQALRERIDGLPPEIEPINGDKSAIMPTPAFSYQKEVIPQEWLSGDIRPHETPEERLEEMREDASLDEREFIEKYSGLLNSVRLEARERAGFDIAHIVGRELWVRNSENLSAQEVMEMPDREIEQLIQEESGPIIEEYGLEDLKD